MDIKSVAKTAQQLDGKSISISALVTLVTMLFPAWLYIDSRYAHADDVKEFTKYQQSQYIEFREQLVLDKIFELEIKPTKTNVDKALLDRYKNELKKLQSNTEKSGD